MSRAAVAGRLRPLLARMRAGEDVPPALWHRAEGFLEALLACGVLDAGQLAAELDAVYRETLEQDAASVTGLDASGWIDADGSVRLRFRLPRAPVYPGGGGADR